MSSLKHELEQEVHSVVILGRFNPAIFHPSWYAQNGLLPKEETDEAADVMVSGEVSTFVVNDVHFQIEQHRFGLTTKDTAKAPLLRDLAIGSFSLLEHTPLTALGLNLDIEYSLPSREAWNEVGDRLTPKACWQGILEEPRMGGVVMLGKRSECTASRISVRVQPVPRLTHGVFVGVNQHYTIETEDRKAVADRNTEVMRILSNDWKPFLAYARRAAESLITGTEPIDATSS